MDKLKNINTTLALIRKDGKILLGEKKRGFAKGTLNGIGGKQDPGETIEQAMIRETQEEVGITPVDFSLIGKIVFDMWYKGEHANMNLYIYNCTKFSGKEIETEEMLPNWYDETNIPFDRMLADDQLWFPLALSNKKFVGNVAFDQNKNMLSQYFKEISSLETVFGK